MRTLLAALALASLAAVACGGNTPAPEAPAAPAVAAPTAPIDAPKGDEAAAGDVKPIGEAKVGDKTKCPVSGEVFTVSETSPKVEHEGKTYYFCCSGCDAKFKADPAKFLAPANKT